MIYTLFCATYLGVNSIIAEVKLGDNILADKQFANLILSAVCSLEGSCSRY